MINKKYSLSELDFYSNLVFSDTSILFHEKHDQPLPHPADIYEPKISRLLDTHKKIFDKSKKHTEDTPPENSSIRDFIYSIDEYYDSLALIIKCFTPPKGEDNRDAMKWLKSQKSLAYTKFRDHTSKNHEIFRASCNLLKHDLTNIRSITVRNHKDKPTSGFFIETVVGPDDLRGPAPNVHKKYKNCATAFSYNHILLKSISHIAETTQCLNEIIFNNRNTSNTTRFTALSSLLKIGMEIPENFFPDEYGQPYPQIKEQKSKIQIIYPSRYRKHPKENFDQIHGVTGFAGVNTRTNSSNYTAPYLPLLNPK